MLLMNMGIHSVKLRIYSVKLIFNGALDKLSI